MGLPALLASALCTFVLPLLLFLAAIKLWDLYCVSSRDRSCSLPLPPGTMGFPFFGETLQMVLQRRKFLQMKRRKYGFIYKTHLFGRPTVRVMGADNVRRILLGEHRLVSVHWPASVRTILGSGCLSNLHDSSHKQRKKGVKARNLIHARIEENIRAKICRLRASEPGGDCKDALQLLIEHSWDKGEPLDMQALKQSSTELLFGGHETTASAATSLISYLGLYPHVLQKVREELKSKGLLCKSNQDNKLDMEILEQLKYIGCVIKETLRLNPPVPGGFRVALKTFELNGYQIPKGWNVIYSICDTHDVADIFTNKEEFNPDRFMPPHPEDASRFSFIPFGGGLRSCVGKEFAKILLKIFTVELARHCDWRLLNGPPTMKTSPTVYPVDNLPARFIHFQGEI
ncbi:cytochrome P450 26A1 isoform X3 [Octodon degus]|uniref:Cytochrome P450 26A1 n=1 Tax=Octodon degus TaxID=10160 RepID=A0A6P6EI34_OCTDE|nr:cytochrome P450 26A1 isoform X3 [Octodon degus]